jgi:hypothetical protein
MVIFNSYVSLPDLPEGVFFFVTLHDLLEIPVISSEAFTIKSPKWQTWVDRALLFGDFTSFFSKMIPNEFWGIEFWRLGKEHIPEERIGQGAAWALKFSSKHLKIPWPVWIQGPRNA